jgi:single-strand DNA-binding protein
VNETMVTVTGNVAGDVIARRVGVNLEHLLVTFRVASSERRWDKATESWVDGDRFTASVNCWRRLAEGARTLTKGDPVIVTGRLSVREYEVEGVRRYMTEISAVAVGPDLARCTADVHRRRPVAVDAGEGATTDENGFGAQAAIGDPVPEEVVAYAGPLTSEAAPPAGGPEEAAAGVDEPQPEGATITGITPGDRRRSGSSRVSA